MGMLRCACVVVVIVMLAACGGAAAPAYPAEKCGAAGSCGRVTTLGYLGHGPGGEFFVDFGKKDVNGSPSVQRVVCGGCPFVVGRTYRARMTAGDPEQVFSILWAGGEIAGFDHPRPDGLNVSHVETWKCDDDGKVPPASHWVLNAEGWPACEPGAHDPIAWVEDTFPDVPGCSRGHPTGLQYASTNEWKILIRLSSAYDLADPQLAHDLFPEAFVAMLNTRGLARGNGIDDGWGPPWVSADGLPNFYFDVTLQMDSTGDHYGMTVSVRGPPDKASLATGGTVAPVFTYTIPTVYKTAGELTRAAVNAAYERLWFGWTCEPDGAHPVQTLEQYCTAQTAKMAETMSTNPAFYEGVTCNY